MKYPDTITFGLIMLLSVGVYIGDIIYQKKFTLSYTVSGMDIKKCCELIESDRKVLEEKERNEKDYFYQNMYAIKSGSKPVDTSKLNFKDTDFEVLKAKCDENKILGKAFYTTLKESYKSNYKELKWIITSNFEQTAPFVALFKVFVVKAFLKETFDFAKAEKILKSKESYKKSIKEGKTEEEAISKSMVEDMFNADFWDESIFKT